MENNFAEGNRMKVSDFLIKHKMGFSCRQLGEVKMDGKTPFKYQVTFTFSDRSYTTEYTMGAAHVYYTLRPGQMADYYVYHNDLKRLQYGEIQPHQLRYKPLLPTAAGVLESILMSCRAIKDTPVWEDFAAEFGYNNDSIKDKSIWEACMKEYSEFRKLVKHKAFCEFLECEPED